MVHIYYNVCRPVCMHNVDPRRTRPDHSSSSTFRTRSTPLSENISKRQRMNYCKCNKTRRITIANGTCVSFCKFWPPWVRLWDNRGKCYMNGKMIQCLSKASQHIPIYLQPFTSYSEILVGNCNFLLPLAFNAPVGVEFREKVWSSEN